MAIPSGTSFHGVSSEVPTENKGSEQTNSRRNSFTIEEIASAGYVKNVKVSLTASQIKSLGTTPIDAISAPGAGKYIRVTDCDAWLTWGSVAFDDNPVTLKTEGAQDVQALDDYSLLARNYTHNSSFGVYETVDPYVKNAKVQIVGTDSVASGDSTLDLYISYQIITL